MSAEVIARGLAFAAAMLLFGASLFLVYSPIESRQAVRRAIHRMLVVGIAVGIVATIVWLIVHAAEIGGESVAAAMSSGTLVTVMRETLFGRVATLRLGIMIVLGVLLVSTATTRAIDIAYAALAGTTLAAMAWMGHAVGESGWDGTIHLGADVVHLLAAGAWLGALPPLAWTLLRAAEIAAQTTQRFSRLGIVCVGALVVTGTINAWFLVGRLDALFTTSYGRLLLLKLALFAIMLTLAAINRFRWSPQIMEGAAPLGEALRRLARNAWIEVACGLAIAFVVGALGVMVPAAHEHMEGTHPPGAHVH